MKDTILHRDICMDFLELPRAVDHHTFYLSSCESGNGIDIQDSNISSRRSSSSSSSSFLPSNADLLTSSSTVHTNTFLGILKRLHYLTIRRQKHGRYGTLSSSLDLFFKKHHHSSINQFHKSSSNPQLTTISQSTITKRSHSHHQLHIIDTNRTETFNSKNNDFNIQRTLLRHIRTYDKIVSEDNNTNTMSSLDLTTIPPALLITDSSSLIPQFISTDLARVSDYFRMTEHFVFKYFTT
jgi:hypothetical protein